MDTLGWDIYLGITLLSFDKKEIRNKDQIVLEQARKLPIKIDSLFLKETKVPCGGFVHISLIARRSAATTRKFLDEHKRIPAQNWFSFLGTIYNNGQRAIQHIPIVGRPLESMAPDAYQNVRISQCISVTDEKKLTYSVRLLGHSSENELLDFQGSFLLE